MNKGGLKYKLIKLQLILTMTVLAISWSLITINDYYVYKNLSIKRFETTARILARNLSTCLAFKDQEECQRVLILLEGESEVLKATVVDARNAVISDFQREESFALEQDLQSYGKDDFQVTIEKDIIRFSYPIYDAETLEGRLFIISKLNLIETFVKRHALFFILIMFASILIGVLLSTHFQRKITNQINLILETINKIKKRQNYSLRIADDISLEKVDIDEFRQLSIAFDDMIEQIQIKDSSLQMRNDDLQRVIENKVQELYKEKEKTLHNAELASLGEMAGSIAHEINNPLAIIITSTSILCRLLKGDNINKEAFLDCLNDVNFTVERIAKIVKGLRIISRRSEYGDKVICTFQDIFDDVFGIAAVKFKSKGIEIKRMYSDDSLTKPFSANRIQLSQVFINLLNNAYDAICDMDEKWIEVQIEFIDNLVTIRIKDSGHGIPLSVRGKMFNPFFTTKDIGKGTGIGLSLSKSMVEKNGGIFFYDEQSKNTCFVIQFPFETEVR